MPTYSDSVSRSPALARGIYIANLVAQCLIVVTGAVVRLTASGLGCPTWPQCVPGSFTPVAHQAQAWHKDVEFGNRLLTFLLVVLAVAAVVIAGVDAWRARRSRQPVRRDVLALAFVPFLGTVAQAVLGGITVLTGLNPLTVGAHLLVSMAIIAGTWALVVRSGSNLPRRPVVGRPLRALAWILLADSALVVTLGTVVTASGPHGGDSASERLAVDSRMVSWFHADLVLLLVGLTVGLLIALHVAHAPTPARRRAVLLLIVILAQGALGYTQYFLGVPETLVALHVTGAVLLWVTALSIPAALSAGPTSGLGASTTVSAGRDPRRPEGTAAPGT